VTTVSASSDNLMDEVGEILQEVSADVIEPRFDALREADVRFKSPGELVTVVDEEAERRLKIRLSALIPEAHFVGEEEFSGSPGLQDALRSEQIWLVDPLDGTANFVSGSPLWAVMVALVRGGETSAAWIWQPAAKVMYQAEIGAGATRNGSTIVRQSASLAASDLQGSVLTKFLDAPTTERVDKNRHCFRSIGPGTTSAGIDYPMLIEGEQDFVMFWRTLPWDHAPGALLVNESGGCVRRLNGESYTPRQMGAGLLAAAGPGTWQVVRDTLLGDVRISGGETEQP
jgi:fructose-1,6-bisphosphatase/inositol monophosphatase family enzyme